MLEQLLSFFIKFQCLVGCKIVAVVFKFLSLHWIKCPGCEIVTTVLKFSSLHWIQCLVGCQIVAIIFKFSSLRWIKTFLFLLILMLLLFLLILMLLLSCLWAKTLLLPLSACGDQMDSHPDIKGACFIFSFSALHPGELFYTAHLALPGTASIILILYW